eukprot:jgi/Chrzof1/6512/Cz18g14040.t1
MVGVPAFPVANAAHVSNVVQGDVGAHGLYYAHRKGICMLVDGHRKSLDVFRAFFDLGATINFMSKRFAGSIGAPYGPTRRCVETAVGNADPADGYTTAKVGIVLGAGTDHEVTIMSRCHISAKADRTYDILIGNRSQLAVHGFVNPRANAFTYLPFASKGDMTTEASIPVKYTLTPSTDCASSASSLPSDMDPPALCYSAIEFDQPRMSPSHHIPLAASPARVSDYDITPVPYDYEIDFKMHTWPVLPNHTASHEAAILQWDLTELYAEQQETFFDCDSPVTPVVPDTPATPAGVVSYVVAEGESVEFMDCYDWEGESGEFMDCYDWDAFEGRLVAKRMYQPASQSYAWVFGRVTLLLGHPNVIL